MSKVRVSTVTGIIGVSGAGKTSLLGTLAAWVWRNFQRTTDLYQTDGGGFPDNVRALIDLGVLRVWRLRTRGEALGTCASASRGFWPERINPATGETEPGVRLLPPITERIDAFCSAQHPLKVVQYTAQLTNMLCPACKSLVTLDKMILKKSASITPGFEQRGAVVFDGLSSMSTWWLHDLDRRAGEGETGGEKSSLGRVLSDDYKWGGTNRASVGFCQERADEFVHNSLAIPGLVVPPIWTMLTHEVDDIGGLSIRGPKLAGRAKTDVAPQWFANMLEAMVVEDEKGRPVHSLRLSEFIDKDSVRHLLKNRAAPGIMPEALTDVYGQPFGQFNLGVFFDLLQLGLEKTTEEYQKDPAFANAPGVKDEIVQIGGVAPSSGVAAVPSLPAVVTTPPTAPAPGGTVVVKKRPAGAAQAPAASVAPPPTNGPGTPPPVAGPQQTVSSPAQPPAGPPRPPVAAPRRPPIRRA